MRGNSDNSRQQHSQARTVSSAGRIWSELVKPALLIALLGAGAVMYLVGCARVSVMECDLRRLDSLLAEERALEFELQRQLAKERSTERIRLHIRKRGLQPPSGHKHVKLEDVPPSLYEALPRRDGDRELQEILVGQLPETFRSEPGASVRGTDERDVGDAQ